MIGFIGSAVWQNSVANPSQTRVTEKQAVGNFHGRQPKLRRHFEIASGSGRSRPFLGATG
jgi:hypothetical protein